MAKKTRKPRDSKAPKLVVNNEVPKPECHKIGCRWPLCADSCAPVTDAAPPLERQPERHQQDVLVNIGDMSKSTIKQVQMDGDYEAMVEDIIGNFNHIVTQGVTPMKALFAMTQAYAICLGCCLRADLPWPVAKDLQVMIMKNAQTAAKAVRIITT